VTMLITLLLFYGRFTATARVHPVHSMNLELRLLSMSISPNHIVDTSVTFISPLFSSETYQGCVATPILATQPDTYKLRYRW